MSLAFASAATGYTHTYAPTAISTTSIAALAASSTVATLPRHAVVLTWEDVVAPTALLARRIGLQPSRQAFETARAHLVQDVYLQQALAGIEEQALALLVSAAAIGPVVLVTDKSLKFMELTCSVFFPRLAAFLLQANMPNVSYTPSSYQQQQMQTMHRIRVVAPPRKFSSAAEHASWRAHLAQSVCRDMLSRDTSAFGLIHVSATAPDAMACIAGVRSGGATGMALVQPKCVQVAGDAESPLSLEAFFAQLQTLQRYVGTAAAHSGAFSMQL